MAKTLWCWRCKREVIMLDEDEFRRVIVLYNTGTPNPKVWRGCKEERLFGPMKREYEEITGVKEQYGSNICHHRVAIYGSPCRACGKPLRSPSAKLCGSCMAPVVPDTTVPPPGTAKE